MQQLIIDSEIVKFVSHFIKGFEFSPEKDFLNIIEEGVKEGTFLSHQTILENYKDVYWFPELFEHESLGQWKEKGGKSIRKRAREIAKKKIAEHEFHLSKDMQKELDKIYKKAEEELI